MRFKVYGGTVLHSGQSLCETCTHSTITNGESLDQQLVECNASYGHARRIPFRVRSCSAYQDARQPSYLELMRKAWILDVRGPKKRKPGFVRGEDLSPQEWAELDNELCDDDD